MELWVGWFIVGNMHDKCRVNIWNWYGIAIEFASCLCFIVYDFLDGLLQEKNYVNKLIAFSINWGGDKL